MPSIKPMVINYDNHIMSNIWYVYDIDSLEWPNVINASYCFFKNY